MSIDTLAVARRLESAKLPREQAEAIAAVIHDSEAATLAGLATRLDVQNGIETVRKELQNGIEIVRKELQISNDTLVKQIELTRREGGSEIQSVRKDIEALRREMLTESKLLEQRMTIKLGMMMVGAIAVIATLIRLL